jgi:membrane-associated protein
MEFLKDIIDVFLHLDAHLNDLAVTLGPWLSVLLFAIIFAETGLVVMPFLPGDSLLFAIGALAAIEGSPLSLPAIIILLIIAAILGDAVNYAIGYRVGPKVFTSETSRLLNKEHLVRTQRFYEKYGAKTIIIARFMPIVRTFAPFVAGIGQMRYPRFAAYNVIGGIVWVVSFTVAGYLFGNVPAVKSNFHYVILAIIILSVMPPIIEFLRARREPV